MERKRQNDEADKKAGNARRKVTAFPGEMIFFFRVLELLQGICSRTGHQVCVSALATPTPLSGLR